MTIRERWIVYPLLFMTLGIAMRDKVAPPSPRFMRPGLSTMSLQCVSLECQDFTLAGPNGKTRVRMGVTPNRAAQLELYGSDHKMVLVAGADNTGRSGRLQTLAADTTPQVTLHSTDRGGQVAMFGSDDESHVTVGYDGLGPGTFLTAPEEDGVESYTCRWWPVRIGTGEDKSDETSDPDSEPADAQPDGTGDPDSTSEAEPGIE